MIITNPSRVVVTTLWLLILAACMSYLLQHLSIVSGLRQFMPSSSDDKHLQVLLHETQNGSTSNLLLMQLGHADTATANNTQLALVSKKLKSRLMQRTDLFLHVFNGESDLAPDDYQQLYNYRYLLTDEPDFSVAALRTGLEHLLIQLRSGLPGDDAKWLLRDPQQSFIGYLKRQAGKQASSLHGVWFDDAHVHALLMVQLKTNGFDLDTQQAAIQTIRATLSQLSEASNIELTLSGPAAMAVATRDDIQHTTQLVSWVLGLIVLILFWYAYRSLRLTFLVTLPLLSAIVLAMTITQWLFNEVHGIVLAFGITLLGVCLDYPLHLFSHLNPAETAQASLQRIWPTLRLGAFTSILGYLAMTGTGFSGLTQLAVFAASGLVVALLVTRWLLPAWLSPQQVLLRTVPVVRPGSFGLRLTLSVLFIVIPLTIIMNNNQLWSNDVGDISPIPVAARNTDRLLRHALHAPEVSHLFMVSQPTLEETLQRTEQLHSTLQAAVDKKMIDQFRTAAQLLPSKAIQKNRQAALPGEATLRKQLDSAMQGMPFKASAYDDFITDVVNSRERSPLEYRDVLQTPLATTLKGMLFQRGGDWYSIVHINGVRDEHAFAEWLRQNPALQDTYIHMRTATNMLLKDYREAAWLRLLAVIAMVMLIIGWQIRARRDAIWIAVPVIAGMLIAMLTPVLLGNPLTVFHVLSLLLVIGMGLDYSLFFNRRWQHEQQLQQRTHAIIISAITTIAAFSILATSTIPVLAAIGQTVATGILSCFLLAQWIVTPQADKQV